jgi:LacI family transcriptional regulator
MGYDLLVSTRPPGEDELIAYKRMVDGGRADGFVIVRTRVNDDRISYLSERGIPFASFGACEDVNNFPFVDEDGAYGMQQVAEHLLKLGHKRIACIAPDPSLSFTAYRLRGLRAGLKAWNQELLDECVRTGDLTQQGGYEQAVSLLDLEPQPTAIAAFNDLMAFGAMRAIQERGLTVGRDIAVTGFDDIPMAAYAHPPLTTVHQPVYSIGTIVCEMVIKTVRGEPLEDPQMILKPSLVIRQSCGATVRSRAE